MIAGSSKGVVGKKTCHRDLETDLKQTKPKKSEQRIAKFTFPLMLALVCKDDHLIFEAKSK